MTDKNSKRKSTKSEKFRTVFTQVSSSGLKETTVTTVTFEKCVTTALVGKDSTVFIGIDPGINPLTVCLISKEGKSRKVSWFSFSSKPTKGEKNWDDRFRRVKWLSSNLDYLLINIRLLLGEMPLDVFAGKVSICVEDYSHASHGSAVQTMAEIKQSILDIIHKHTKRFKQVLVVPIPTWKSCICPGSTRKKDGIDSKAQIKNCLISEFDLPDIGKDHNKYDSYAMALLFEILSDPELMKLHANKHLDKLYLKEKERLINDSRS